MTTDRDTLALAVFIGGAFKHAGLDEQLFNHRTPLSVDLLLLVGEDLLDYADLLEAATKNLSVLEVLRGERVPTPRPAPTLQASWTRVQAGRGSRLDTIQAELYLVICGRLNLKPERLVTRAEQLEQLKCRANAKRKIAAMLRGRGQK